MVKLARVLREIGSRLFPGRAPRAYRERPCQGRMWRRAFPRAPKTEVRAFLSIFADAFAYGEREKLKFRPDDALMGIYRAMYPRQWMADSLEMETFDMLLQRRYGVTLSSMWRDDLTLGDVFAATRAQVDLANR